MLKCTLAYEWLGRLWKRPLLRGIKYKTTVWVRQILWATTLYKAWRVPTESSTASLPCSYTLLQPSIFGHHGKQDAGLRWTFARHCISICVFLLFLILPVLLWVGLGDLVVPVLCSTNQTFLSLLWASVGGSYTLRKVSSGPCLGRWLRIEEGQGGGVGCFLDKRQIISGIWIMDEIFLWLQVFPSLRRGWEFHSLWAHEPLVCPVSTDLIEDALTPSLDQARTVASGLSLASSRGRLGQPTWRESSSSLLRVIGLLLLTSPSFMGDFKDDTYLGALNRVSFSRSSFYIPPL